MIWDFSDFIISIYVYGYFFWMILCLFVKKVKKGIFCMYYLFILEMNIIFVF